MKKCSRVEGFPYKYVCKTEYMQCNFANRQVSGDLKVKLGDETISQVKKIKYLGSNYTKKMVRLMVISIIEFELDGISRKNLLEFFVTKKYPLR